MMFHELAVGAKFAIQPALNYKGSMASPGYSYRWCGGAAPDCTLSRRCSTRPAD